MTVSPGSTWPFGSASTREPSAARRVGTITATSRPRTSTPPAENSRLPAAAPSAALRASEDILLPGLAVVDAQAAPALRDHPGTLEHGQKAARGLARGAGQLGEVRLRGRDEHVAAV